MCFAGWWFQPLWKIWLRQLAWLFPIYGKIRHVPNHQTVCKWGCPYVTTFVTSKSMVFVGLFGKSSAGFQRHLIVPSKLGHCWWASNIDLGPSSSPRIWEVPSVCSPKLSGSRKRSKKWTLRLFWFWRYGWVPVFWGITISTGRPSRWWVATLVSLHRELFNDALTPDGAGWAQVAFVFVPTPR
jgi:hypothetical protein